MEGDKQIPTYDVRVWARQLTRPLGVIGYSPFPNLKGMEVSTKLTPLVSATIANNIWDWEQQEADFLRQYGEKTEEVKSLTVTLYHLKPASKEYATKRDKLSGEIKKAKAQQDTLLQNYLGRVKRADLRNAKLRYLDAERTFLAGANVAGADMRRAQLQEANLIGLRGGPLGTAGEVNYVKPVDFEQASLWHANLIGAYLNYAHLYGADLTRANLTRAHLYGAYLTRAHLTDANHNGTDLTGATGITKEQVLLAKWREVPKGLPAEWKLTPKHNWTKDDEDYRKLKIYPNGY
ncbi:hypothetical protein LBMAG21_14650 [Armatimonadota bacterium]|nr:hypothetical protein LBMAG21_14650 [Armatimonadota bacterium]